MKKLKLEVGKTYRSREGEEVRIVRKTANGRPPFQGSDGEWYTENGRWQDFGVEFPEDLVEEVVVSDASQKHNEMEVLALQVGKTYRNRKGEEVNIVGKHDKNRHPYQGSNGKVYAENGKWGYLCDKHPEDIIKEVPTKATSYALGILGGMKEATFALVPEALTATRYTFDIPDGMKKVTVSQEGNRIVVEMVPEKEPKPGDVMTDAKGNVYIFKSVVDGDIHRHFAWLGQGRSLAVNTTCAPGRPATPEEAQPLFDALKKAGKRWNAETMEVEDVPEIDRIREWVEEHLNDGHYNQQWIAGVIGRYLKHREGEQ